MCDRETEKQIEKQIEKQREKQREKETQRERNREKERESRRESDQSEPHLCEIRESEPHLCGQMRHCRKLLQNPTCMQLLALYSTLFSSSLLRPFRRYSRPTRSQTIRIELFFCYFFLFVAVFYIAITTKICLSLSSVFPGMNTSAISNWVRLPVKNTLHQPCELTTTIVYLFWATPHAVKSSHTLLLFFLFSAYPCVLRRLHCSFLSHSLS